MMHDVDVDESDSLCLELETRDECFEFYHKYSVDGCFKFFHSNIRSFSHNLDPLLVYLSDFVTDLDFIILTECWLRGGEEGVVIEGFEVLVTETQNNQNDGVVVLVNKRLSVTHAQITIGGVNGIIVDFTYHGKHFNLLSLYRTHDSNLDCFITELENYYDNLSLNKSGIFLGDLNIDILQNSATVNSYLNCLQGAGLVQCIDRPTRPSDGGGSCLDHIFVRVSGRYSLHAAVIQTGITDHHSTGLVIATTHTDSIDTASTAPRTYIDYTLLSHNLAQLDWTPVFSSMDVDSCAMNFCTLVGNCLLISKKQATHNSTRTRKLKPWITLDLINQIRTRDKISKRVKKQPFNVELQNYYRNYRQNLGNSIRRTKREYYRAKIGQSQNSPKKFWNVLNELAGRLSNRDSFPINKFLVDTSNITDEIKKQVANDFNSFFSSVGQNLANAIKSVGEPVVNDEDYRVNSKFMLRPVTKFEVLRQVSGLRGGSAPGHDNVSVDILKQNFLFLDQPLLYLINLSLMTGVFPNHFKLAKVFPLHKSDDFCEKSNFRPISLLSVFSKVLERIVKEQLTAYLHNNNILSESQYGFRRDKNITNALFDINRDINSSISSGWRSMLVFLDLKKAFDSVDRSKLILKLENAGIRDNALKWFRSYLAGRRQVVSICGTDSDSLPVDYGVVQGSTLGPILFLIYINNISKVPLHGKLTLFADDTVIFLQAPSWSDVRTKALSDLTTLKKWFDQNVLSLNTSKTKFMPISLRSVTDYYLQDLVIHSCGNYLNTLCNCASIEKVLFYRYLGVVFDSRMSWAKHVHFLIKKVRKYYFAFRQLNEVLYDKEIKLAYFGYIQSVLNFGIIAWGGANSTILQPLFIAQKRILKIGFKKPMLYPTSSLFQEISVLTIRQLFIKTLLGYIFSNSQTIFREITHPHNTRFSDKVGFVSAKLHRHFSTTNAFYISSILHRNVCVRHHNASLFDSPSLRVFNRRVHEWLLQLGIEESEFLIGVDSR